MSDPILPEANLGMLGSGQLGRMFTLEARRMGYRVTVFGPDENSPAGQIANKQIQAPYDDLDAVRALASEVSVVSFEFENVPADTAAAAAEGAHVRPAGSLLHTTQNRQREKEALSKAGAPVADFAVIETEPDLERGTADVRAPWILKTASSGYDGKGQVRCGTPEEAASAWDSLDRSACVLETVVSFESEISVVGARGVDGEVALYDPLMNDHVNHILDTTISPANVSAATRDKAHEIMRLLLDTWEVIGVMCVEMFLMADGDLVVNEIAPRPHNSGHLTIDAHVCSQFEQQVRAVCGLPLGSTHQTRPAAMSNLLGDLWQDGTPKWDDAMRVPETSLHLYGKAEARPGRKMGHITALGDTTEEAVTRALSARSALNR